MVDDNKHGLTARKAVLEEQGHAVTAVLSGQEALEQFARHHFDLVVTDYRMPRMNGLELIAALRQVSPSVPVILLSGFVDTLGLTEQGTGADGVLQKSAHEVPHLIRMVTRLLARRKPKAPRKPAAAESRSAPPAARKNRAG
jgi:CheY-like chemotaxis protein